jgi:hypothetical protein
MAYLAKKEKENPEIKIENVDFSNNTIYFTVNNFKRKKSDKKMSGKVLISLKVVDDKEKIVFQKDKKLILYKKSSKIIVAFKGIKEGYCYVFIDAVDLLTKRRCNYTKSITIK